MVNVIMISVQKGHCTDERTVQKAGYESEKRCDLRRQQKMEREREGQQ